MNTPQKTLVILGFILCCTNLFCLDYSQEYQLLYNDLVNWNSIGYRSHFDEVTNKESESINKDQGALIRSTDQHDIAINGYGYFRLIDENNNEYYSRKAKLSVYENEYALVPDELLNIDSSVMINNEQIFLVKNDGLIITNKNIIGKVDVYDFDTKDITHVIKDRIFLNKGSKVTKVSTSNIVQYCLETSNVNIERTLCRMLFLLESKSISNYESKIEIVKLLLYNKFNMNSNINLDIVLPFLAFAY